MADLPMQEENLGNGIILHNNKLCLDFSGDNIWTGKNTFAKVVSFTANQTFPINNLSHENFILGSLIVSNGVSWQVLKPTKNNYVLTFTSRGVNWAPINLNQAEGVLPVSKGGTGWSLFPTEGILVNTGKEVLDLLPIPKERKVLLAENKTLTWVDFASFSKEFMQGIKTIYVNGNQATFEEFNPVFKLRDNNLAAGLSFESREKQLIIGLNHSKLKENDLSSSSAAIILNIKQPNFSVELAGKTVFSVDESGLISGQLSVDSLKGVLPLSHGGTGISSYDKGDILYADSDNNLVALSTQNCEGFYLQVKNGVPVYSPIDRSGFDGHFDFPITLGKSPVLPSLRFQRLPLIEKAIEGGVEFDGNYLFVTTSRQRKALAFLSSDITGTAQNVRGIVGIENGGTGANLIDFAPGQIIIKGHDQSFASFEQGMSGQVLMSQGPGSNPTWKNILVDLETNENSGVVIQQNEGITSINLDQSINFNPFWQGNHTFVSDVTLANKAQLILSETKKAPIKFQPTPSVSELTGGEIWFDGNHLIFNSGQKRIILTEKESKSEYIPSHYLTLAAGSEVVDNRKIRMKVPVPHLTTQGALAQANWKIRRLEILFDEAPTEQNAVFKLYCGNKVLIDQGLVNINKESESFENFNEVVVTTGEMLQLECVSTGGSNYWSAFLLIDLL